MKELTTRARAGAPGPIRLRPQGWKLLFLLPLILVVVACGGGGDAGGTDRPTAEAPQPTGTQLPDDVAGRWNTILTYVPAYYTGIIPTNDFIGSISVAMSLQSDGSYQFDLRSAASYFNGHCHRTTHWSETGKVSVTDASITFTSMHATDIVMDSCGAARYVDPAPTGTATYGMTRELDQTGWPRLRLRMPNGEDLVLERCRDCG